MSHLAAPESAARRRLGGAWRLAPLALVAALSAALVGCSAGGGSDAGGAAGDVVVGVEDQADGSAADPDRSVIIEGTMSVVVADVADATTDAVGIADGAGGRVDGREEWHDGYGDDAVATTTLVLRIPAPALDGALEDLRGLGSVQSLQTSTVDVTSDVEDVDARVDALESTIARLKTFQSETTSVTDLLAVEGEIAERQAELESYLTRQADLAEQVSFSTLTLTLQSESAPPSTPDSFWSGLVLGWNGMMAFLAGLAVVIGVMLPWLIGLGLIAAVIVFLIRWIRRRRPTPPTPPAPPGHTAAWPAEATPRVPADSQSAPPAP